MLRNGENIVLEMLTIRLPTAEVIAFLLLIGFSTSVLASDLVLGPVVVSPLKLLYVFLMGLWGALAALLQRLAKGVPERVWKVAALRDLVNATLASLMAFLVCEHFQVPPALEAVAFTLAGYGGARFMEFIYQRFIWKIKNVVESDGTDDKPKAG